MTRQASAPPAGPGLSEFLPRSADNTGPHTLSTSEATTVLGLTRRDLAGLTEAGWLRPAGPPTARRWPLDQIQALLNTSTAGACGDPRPGYLQALGDLLAGHGLCCQVCQHDDHPHLLARSPGGAQTTVWLVRASTGWRFLWRRYRSHPAFDLPGAATTIMADVGPVTGHTIPAPAGARHSADHSSVARKRALRRLAREQPDAYTTLYQRIRPRTPSHTHARNQAWTQLRYQYPGRYRELYEEERPQAAKPPRLTGTRTAAAAGVSRSGEAQ
jgi:hypothetical protein